MTLKVASDRTSLIATKEDEVKAALKEALRRIEEGEWRPNQIVMILAENEIDTFAYEVNFRCRALEALGLIDVMRDHIRSEMSR